MFFFTTCLNKTLQRPESKLPVTYQTSCFLRYLELSAEVGKESKFWEYLLDRSSVQVIVVQVQTDCRFRTGQQPSLVIISYD